MEKKYVLTDETRIVEGRTLYRIKAVRDFGNVKAGQLGGWVEDEWNLSHLGNCWIADDACVYDKANISDAAQVRGKTVVAGNAKVGGAVSITSNTRVFGNARVFGEVCLTGNVQVSGDAHIAGKTYICGNALIS
jgi:NDP-sugar pyrophosphorylase family protein